MMKKVTIWIAVLVLILNGCEEQNMATTAKELGSTLISTNVTDDRYETLIKTARKTAVGRFSHFVIKDDGTLWATGLNSEGQLGVGDTTNRDEFTFTGMADVLSVIAGGSHSSSGEECTYIIKSDGTLWATGKNTHGKLGLGDTDSRSSFTYTGITNVKDVFTSDEDFVYIATNNGNIYSTGVNNSGQLGLGDTSDRYTFNIVDASNINTVSVGIDHVLILTTDGEVWTTGANDFGQLGLGDNSNRSVFTKTDQISVINVIAGGSNSMVIKGDGTLYGSGFNGEGALGFGDNTNRDVFTYCNINDVKNVSLGLMAIVVRNDGVAWSSGKNFYGQLGVGDNSDRNSFVSTGKTNVKDVFTVANSTYLLTTSGSVFSTGLNGYGELGVGDTTDRNSFTDTSISGVKELYVGRYFCSIVNSDNTISSTGFNSFGSLGLGDITDRNSFINTGIGSTPSIVDIYRYTEQNYIYGDVVYALTPIGNTPSQYYTLAYLQPILPLLPFDELNTSKATIAGTMTYKIQSNSKFNSFTLAGVTAEYLSYTIRDELDVLVKTESNIPLDCWLDDDELLDQGEITKLISAGEIVPSGGTVEIELTNTGNVQLGTFKTNAAVDEGATEMLIKAGFRDTNSYAEDPWGNIEEGVKPITRKFDITVIVEYSKFDKTYRRHKSFLGKFITLDGTDATLTENGLTLHSLVARGLIISVGHETLTKDNDMKPYYKYNMSFLEIV